VISVAAVIAVIAVTGVLVCHRFSLSTRPSRPNKVPPRGIPPLPGGAAKWIIDGMSETTIALVTGASRGLGRETVRRLTGLGWTVLAGARRPADVTEGEPVTLDVISDESVAAAAELVRERHGRLDVLVNNAGIMTVVAPAETGPDDLAQVYETNVLGPVRVTRAFLPLLEASAAPRIVMVSSGLGSSAWVRDPDRTEFTVNELPYTSSKAALNMITMQYAKALPHMRVNAADPGYTATEINGNSGPQTVEEGTDAVVRLAQLPPDGPTGTFTDRTGEIPW
jgi:NAD(P)-dependent dehydrogenase (short-subunit alcohol dehydrogenase family)